MSLISMILVLVIAGFACWLLLQIPMPHPFPQVIAGLICLFVVLWLLQSLGLVNTNLRLR